MSQPLIGSLCSGCRHIRADYTCTAFPRGIPDEIVRGIDHTGPVKGDRGIRFEARPADEPAPEFEDLMLQEANDYVAPNAEI
jgi:hypothetical protein